MNIKPDFLHSLLSPENEFQDYEGFTSWLKERTGVNYFKVDEIPFDKLEKWYFEESTKNLRHTSGKFFSIEGLNVSTNFGPVRNWNQPIIFQPETGILGIITKVICNRRYFLMQAKMEPGNINILQVSPTVQATRSNYTQVHKGSLPKYLDYFTDPSKSIVISDTLQPEQSGRFYRKINRNMVVEVQGDLPVYDDFIWLTLGQIKKALKSDNIINMDSRSVLATIPIVDSNGTDARSYLRKLTTEADLVVNFEELFLSACENDSAFTSMPEIRKWISEVKKKYFLEADRIPLSEISDWLITDRNIVHETGKFFEVIAVGVHAGNREVVTWTQPMIKDQNLGLIGFLVKEINGILHFLVQAKVEPGCHNVLDLAPTVSCSNFRHVMKSSSRPLFMEFFEKPDPTCIIYSAVQSEEGGRFYHFRNLNMIIGIKQDELKDIPDNFHWITLHQIMKLMQEGYMNIESRSLISALSLV